MVGVLGLTIQDASAATYFSYTVSFKYQLQGRDMSGHSDYCNYFHATFHEPGYDPTITIQLKQNVVGTDPGFLSVTYPTDGGTYYNCWRGFSPSSTYYFLYTKNNNTMTVSGAGSVSDN
jgi:hypothetical protein